MRRCERNPVTPELSVVISTFNRRKTLRRSLEHLAKQDFPASRFEVWVCDDGSVDGTSEAIAELQPQMPFRLRYLRHPNRGPGFTHNRGLRAAAAPVVVLLADDILLEPGALSAHAAAHREFPDARVAFLGNVRQSPELVRTAFERHWEPHRNIRDLPDRAELPGTLFWAIHLSFKRAFALDGGSFREDIGEAGPAAHEDTEFGFRLAKRGLRLIHCKGADAQHHHPETLESASLRAYERGFNWHAFAAELADPALAVRYQVLSWSTLFAHVRALGRRSSGVELDRDVGAAMLFKNGVRHLLFNRALVRGFWDPLLAAAERSRRIERVVPGAAYRGVVHFHFRRGLRDARRQAGTAGRRE